MKKKYYLIFALVILIVVAIAGSLLLNSNAKQQNNANLTNKNVNQQRAAIPNNPRIDITLTSTGFNPETVTIKTGTRVFWLNKSGTDGSVNSDNHPTNLLFPFLNLGEFDNRSSVSVVFEKAGKYTYHNEVNPDQRGTVIVE